MLKDYAKLVVKRPALIVSITLLTTLFLGFFAKDIKLDNNFALLFSTNNADADYRAFFRDEFGPDDSLLIAIIDSERSDPKQVEPLIEGISNQLDSIPHFNQVDSITHTSVIWSEDDTLHIEPAFGQDSPLSDDMATRLDIVWNSTLGGNRLVSEDGRFFLIMADMVEELDTHEEVIGPATEFQDLIRQAVHDSQLDLTLHFAGIAYTRVSAIGQMQGDLLLLAPVTTLILAILLYILFRDLRILFVVQLSIGFATIITAGVIRLFDDNINQLTVIYPVLLMVVVTANALHILHRYFAEIEKNPSPELAIQETILHTIKACWLSSMTTAIGFASLVFAEMFILNSFGLYLAIGVVSGFFIVSSFIPAMLALMKITQPKRTSQSILPDAFTQSLINKTIKLLSVPRNVNLLHLLSVGGFIGLLWSSSGINYDYSLSGMLKEDDPISIGNQIIDDQLAGVIPIEISVLGESDQFKRVEALALLEQIENWLITTQEVDRPKSLASVMKEINEQFSGNNKLPENDAMLAQLLLLAESSPDGALQQLVTDNYAHARVRTSTVDLGANYVVDMNREFKAFIAELLVNSDLEVEISMTGEAPVAYEGMNRLSQELFESVLLALVVISICILVVFRDVWLTLASLIPNIIPIALGLFVYQASQDVLDPLPCIAFCIAIGIAVDDTVHLLAKYNELGHLSGMDRMKQALQGVIHPLVNSTIILSCGFMVLTLSSFTWNQLLGLLGALMIVFALVCDILLTPAVIVSRYKDQNPTNQT